MRDVRKKVLIGLMLIVLAACGADPRTEDATGNGRRSPLFKVDRSDSVVRSEGLFRGAATSLAELVAASTLVVEGDVVAVTSGVQPGPNDHPKYGHNRVEIAIRSLLKGAASKGSIFLEQVATVDGKPLDLSGIRIAKVGDHAVYFLSPFSARPGTFEFYNNQSQFVQVQNRLVGSDDTDPLVQRLNESSIEEFIGEIRSVAGSR